MKACRHRNRIIAPVAALLFPLWAATSAAADDGAPAQPPEDRWQFTITPYLWVPSLDTTLSVRDEPIEVEGEVNSFDLLEHLGYAFMVSAEARKGKFGVWFDTQGLKLGEEGTLDTPRPRDADYDLSILNATLALEYRVVQQPKFSLDVLGGARVFYADVEIDVDPAAGGPGLGGAQSEAWVDPVVGLKAQYWLGDAWAIDAYADVGGFGVSSEFTYQAFATVSYYFNENFALAAGYRVLGDRFEDGDFKFDATVYGPTVGLTFKF